MFTLFYFVPRVPLLKTMAEKGWCQLVPSLLHTTENDTREKVLQALHVMVEGCKSEFQQPRVHDSLNKLKLEWLKDVNRKEGHEDPEYVTILAQLVTDLISKLTWWIWLVYLASQQGQTVYVWLLTILKLIVALIRSLGQWYKQCSVKARFLLGLLQCWKCWKCSLNEIDSGRITCSLLRNVSTISMIYARKTCAWLVWELCFVEDRRTLNETELYEVKTFEPHDIRNIALVTISSLFSKKIIT